MIWKKLVLFIFICFIYFEAENKIDTDSLHNKELYERVYREWVRGVEFTPERFKDYLYSYNLSEEVNEIIITQSILETGFYSSLIFKESNNLFGMKHPRIRETTSIGVNRGHAVYNHWTESVDDYILWMNYYDSRGILCLDEYKKFLRRVGYAEDPLYINKLITLNI